MEIVNRVANSSLLTFDLAEYITPGERVVIDLKDLLYEGLILREKDLRNYVSQLDGASYKHKWVTIVCSADVVIPTWAFMLVASAVSSYAEDVIFGSRDELETLLFHRALAEIDWEQYRDARVVIKGCSQQVPTSAYVQVINRLQPLARSIMYGEACSAVPVYKKK